MPTILGHGFPLFVFRRLFMLQFYKKMYARVSVSEKKDVTL